jgi:hypothetical protein
MPSLTTCRACGERICGEPRQLADEEPLLSSDGFYRHVGCSTDQRALAQHERDRQIMELRLRSRMSPRADQDDAAHLPLFVAANEPTFL